MEASSHDWNISVGTRLSKDGKDYLVIYADIINAGHTRILHLIRIRENWQPIVRFIKEVYDADINKYEIIHY